MAGDNERVEQYLENLALEVVSLEEGDIPSMGKIMNIICSLEEACQDINDSLFESLLKATKQYLEKLILGETSETEPIEKGVAVLQDIYRALARGEEYKGDASEALARLGIDGYAQGDQGSASEDISEQDEAIGSQGPEIEIEAAEENEGDQPGRKDLSEEDKEIMADFVVEALENLSTIEVNLIELEHNPNDIDTINAIFRPFHTIKGVSGFLNLEQINKLSHSAENLLDLARSGELAIDGAVIDIILESVDMLKEMIEEVRKALDAGRRPTPNQDIGPLVTRIQEIISASQEHKNKPLGELLVEKGAVETDDIEVVLEEQKKDPNKKVGEILVEKGIVKSKEVITALREQKRSRKKKVDFQVKVDTKKLDTLVDMTGELVIAQAILRQNESILSIADQRVYYALNQLYQISSTLQKTAMAMRMIPIKSTFQKMLRLVRDLSRSSGKKVALKMSGEDTEIDRNVVEEIYEPMVHMIRNAVDHGIETPNERVAVGKPKEGTVELKAYQKGSNIIIEIKDDGRGLDKDKILEKAISKGIVSESASLSEGEIYNLIFKPGFSTADVVTDISGRGVGMDVVKKAIEKLRGRVEIQSQVGKGSTFVIALPLTLAIVDGIIVRIAGQRYIIPALGILKSFKPRPSDYSTVEGRGEMIMVRGELIPLVRLNWLFQLSNTFTNPWDGLAVVVENEGEKLCLLVDELLGKEEVVIKSLGEGLKDVKGLAGGAILGDGRVGLILDIAGLFQIAKQDTKEGIQGLQRVA